MALLPLTIFAATTAAVSVCLPLGPVYPVPTAPSRSQALKTAFQDLENTIAQSLQNNGSSYGQLDPNTTSFIMEVYSVHEVKPLFEHSFSAPELANAEEGVQAVSESTIFRLGSMSKLLSVYNFLIHAGDDSWNQPITRYIPELADAATQTAGTLQSSTIVNVDWDTVTVGSLASQMAGIARESPFGPISDASLLNNLPLPELPAINGTFCNPPDETQIPCTRAGAWYSIRKGLIADLVDFFMAILQERPVVPSWHTPIYSNVAFQILSYALENITAIPFNQSFKEGIITPLGLNDTFLTVPPTTNNSIIPYNQSWSDYAWDMRDEAPAGGYYSTIRDLRAIGKSILNSTLIPDHMTRRWMKPVTFTGSVNVSVGAPWEIVRIPTDRNVWMYTKGGHVGSYTSEIILIPEYNIGATVLTAGVAVSQDVDLLANLFAEIIAPVLEDASKEEASAIYVGLYQLPGSNSSITIETDSFPGLLISNFTYNDTDAIQLIGELVGSGTDGIELRLWPTTLTTHKDRGTDVPSETSWRVVVQKLPVVPAGPFLGNCISWLQTAAFTYAGVGIDEMVFELNSNGTKATSLDARFFDALYVMQEVATP